MGTVIGLGRRDNLPALRLSPGDVIHACGPDGGLVGLGASRHEPHPGEPRGSNLHQLRGQCLLPWIGQPVVVQVSDPARLLPDQIDEVAAAVAEGGGHGATAHGIQVTLAGGVLHAGAIPSDDDPIRPRQLELEHGPGAGRYERCSRLQSASNRFPAGLPPGCTLETGTAANSGAPTAGQDTNRRRHQASSLTTGGSAGNQLPVR